MPLDPLRPRACPPAGPEPAREDGAALSPPADAFASALRRSRRFIHLLALSAAALMLTAHVAGEGREDLADPERLWPGDPILYELQVFTSSGDLLFNPRLLGEADSPARLELWGPSCQDRRGAPRLRVSLDALAARDGLDMAMELSVGGLVEKHSLRLRMPMNEGQTLWVPTDDGRSLGMTLRAYKVGSSAFDAYVDAMQRRTLARSMPEA